MTEISVIGRLPAVLTPALANKAVREALKVAHRKYAGSLSLVFVDEKRMKALNKEHRGCPESTDVLSFSPADFPVKNAAKPGLGDIIISPAYVRRDAGKSGVAYPQQLVRVLVHGVLHLSGYDHATVKEETKMFALQEKAIKACGL
ncbi:MAG: rRNA maturation RNase YbeY [Patescibacteria group bacterium]